MSSPPSLPTERLYPLLPSLYRLRDAGLPSEPLRALVGLLDEQLQWIEADIAGLYESWFIETCDDWVVPYIGDLLGVRGLHPVSKGTRSQRAIVANTLAYRRRKGTAAALEKLAQDVTGWPARVVEYFQLVATTAHVNHERPDTIATASLRGPASLELLGSAFETTAHLPEIRHIASRRGKYDMPYVGIHLCRLVADYSEKMRAARFDAGRFHVHPLGCDAPLFNPDRTVLDFAYRAKERDLPVPLRRRPLYDELERWRLAQTGAGRAELVDFLPSAEARPLTPDQPTEPVARVFLDGVELLPEEIEICDLSGDPALADSWPIPDAKTFVRNDSAHSSFAIRAALDPVAGRLALPAGEDPEVVHVRCAMGFSARVAGGFYEREDAVPPIPAGTAHIVVAGGGAELDAALAAWAALAPGPDGTKRAILEIADSETYDVTTLTTTVPPHGSLMLRASNRQRPLVRLATTWVVSVTDDSELVVAGALVSGNEIQLDVAVDTSAARVRLEHATLVPGWRLGWDGAPNAPGGPSVSIALGSRGALELALASSISGPIAGAAGPSFAATVTLTDAIVDAMDRTLAAVTCHTARIERTTVMGKVETEILTLASDDIFTDPVRVRRTQEGCVRYSYVAPGSKLPRAHRCQPDWALREARAGGMTDPLALASLEGRIVPAFTSTRYGDPAYAQLHATSAPEIRTGASEEGEMGAFHLLQQPQREANLRASIDDYLRFGLEAGIFFVT